MDIEDFDYETDCGACEGGQKELEEYDECPGCSGEGTVNRLLDGGDGQIRLSEGISDMGLVTFSDLPIEGSRNSAGFKEMYGDKDIDDIIDEAYDAGNNHTAEIFENLKDEMEENGILD